MKVPNCRASLGLLFLSLSRLQNEGSQRKFVTHQEFVSLSRLQNEGSQPGSKSRVIVSKSIKATE